VPDTFDTGPGPSRFAFLLAYAGVVLTGFVGALIGYGWADIGCTRDCGTDLAVAMIVGGIIGAVGAGVIAVLVLRAMAEWRRPG
jgi:NhaP-type Na+/H+ or K+/H+ antiporter